MYPYTIFRVCTVENGTNSYSRKSLSSAETAFRRSTAPPIPCAVFCYTCEMFEQFLQTVSDFFTDPIRSNSLVLPFSPADLMLKLVLPLALGLWVAKLLRKVLLNAIAQSSIQEKNKKKIARYVRVTLRLLSLGLLVLLIDILFGGEFFTVLAALGSILSTPFFSSGELSVSILTLLGIIPVVIFATWVSKKTHYMVEHNFLRRLPMDASQRFSISNIVRYSTMLVALILGLGLVGINLSSLMLLFGVLGIGIGFGLQNTVANFFAGLVIIMAHPIKEGDYIRTNSSGERMEGTVVKITLLHSIINTLFNEAIIVPNAEIINKTVHNFSYNSHEITVLVTVQVHYDSDIDAVEKLLVELAKKCPHWNGQQEPVANIRNFAASGIELGVLVRISDARNKMATKTWIYQEVWRQFKLAGIIIPYPQLDLHLLSDGSPDGSPEQ